MAEMKKELTPEEKWQRATLADSFIFYKVMRHHPDACKELIEILLGIKVESITMMGEEAIIVAPDAKSIRLDVYVKTKDRNFDLEMQVVNTGELPQRSRYYQGLMDLDSLKKGDIYSDLKESHVIFICMEDVFEKKLPVYTFQYRCDEDREILLGDKTFKHFFIAPRCAKLIKNEEEKAFFELLIKNTAAGGFALRLYSYIEEAKLNPQWRHQYMTWEMVKNLAKREGFKEGVSVGAREGAKEKAVDNARNFLKMNVLTAEQIAQGTGLSLEEVLALKDELTVS